jgi:hypothetical protein
MPLQHMSAAGPDTASINSIGGARAGTAIATGPLLPRRRRTPPAPRPAPAHHHHHPAKHRETSGTCAHTTYKSGRGQSHKGSCVVIRGDLWHEMMLLELSRSWLTCRDHSRWSSGCASARCASPASDRGPGRGPDSDRAHLCLTRNRVSQHDRHDHDQDMLSLFLWSIGGADVLRDKADSPSEEEL